jgi:hypothetical protein
MLNIAKMEDPRSGEVGIRLLESTGKAVLFGELQDKRTSKPQLEDS